MDTSLVPRSVVFLLVAAAGGLACGGKTLDPDGGAACAGNCDDAGSEADGPDSSSAVCPQNPATHGAACDALGLDCSWPTSPGCGGVSCTCSNDTWQCSPLPCPGCPSARPVLGGACAGTQECSYLADCGDETCQCEPTGIWLCTFCELLDGGK